MPGPGPAEAALAAAVRGVRVAAAKLGQPLGAVGFALAAAEALPSIVEPALEALHPSPFETLFGLAGGAAGVPVGPHAARREAPRGARGPSRVEPAGGPGAPAAPLPALVEIVQEVVAAAGEAAVRAASPVLPARPAPSGIGALVGALVGPSPPQDVLGGLLGGLQPHGAAAPARPVGGMVLQPVVDEVFAAGRSALGTMAAATRAVVPPAEPALRQLQRLVTEAEIGLFFSRLLPDASHAAPSVAAGGRSSRAPTAAGPQAAGAPVAGGPSPAAAPPPALTATPGEPDRAAPAQDVLRETLLTPAPAPRVRNGAAPVPAEAGGASVPVQVDGVEQGELARFVNEALVEQARRHGMDLT